MSSSTPGVDVGTATTYDGEKILLACAELFMLRWQNAMTEVAVSAKVH